MNGFLDLPEALRHIAQSEAQAMMDSVDGLQAVVVASVDGFDLVSCAKGGIDPARIAAMASSIAAIGDVVAQEVQLGDSRSVTINTEHGFAVVHHVRGGGQPLVINAVAGAEALVGEVVYRLTDMARKLVEAQ